MIKPDWTHLRYFAMDVAHCGIGFAIRWQWRRLKEHLVWHAAGAIPRGVRYWIVIRATVEIAGKDRHPDSVTAMELLDLLGRGPKQPKTVDTPSAP